MVTGATFHRKHFFSDQYRLKRAQETLFETTARAGWILIAWALFSDHYHWISRSPEVGGWSLKRLVQAFHSLTARSVNQWDHTPGQKVW